MANYVSRYTTKVDLVTDEEISGKKLAGLVLPSDIIADELNHMR